MPVKNDLWARLKIKKKRIKTTLRHRQFELANYIAYLFKPSPPPATRVLIFAHGRTGSTVLESLLASTGHFHSHGELLESSVRGTIIWPLALILGAAKRQAGNCVSHVKVAQITVDRARELDPAHFLETLQNNGWKIIYLRRQNKLRHMLSQSIAVHRGDYHKYDDEPEAIRLTLEREFFLRFAQYRDTGDKLEAAALQNVDYLPVFYEADLESGDNHQETVNKILDYLGLERREVHTKHRKINQSSIKDIVLNYDDLEAYAKEYNYSQYLDGD